MIISVSFFGILCLSAIIYWRLPRKDLRTVFLIIISLVFVGLYDKLAILMILFLTVYAYSLASLIEKQRRKKVFHRLGIAGLVLVLVAFKYLGFLAKTLSSLTAFIVALPRIHFESLMLPLGISYIVFKYISYLTDVYWGIVKKGSFPAFLLYGSLFTIYVAGPIERFERFKPQIEGMSKFQWADLEDAFRRIVFGLFKKLVIADWIGYLVSRTWENGSGHPPRPGILALCCFSIQIYMDFSGYSDIAIGSSRLFGLRIMENFRWPYLQPNISRFWRSWHISLSDWIRDYLFFPLSGLRQTKLWLNLFVPLIAMGLCGLWHGAEWRFVLWGIWHGLGLAGYQAWTRFKRTHAIRPIRMFNRPVPVFGTIGTFAFVTFSWLFFR